MSSSESDQERNEHEESVPRGSAGSVDKKRKRQDYETPKKQYHSSPESEERNEHEESVPRGSAGSGDKNRKRQDYETPEKRPNHHNPSPKRYSSNSGRSTIKTSEKHPPSAGEESKRRRRVSFPSPSEETSGWAKLMRAHFELLETQIGALTTTMKEFRSAFNNQQGILSTDKD